MNGPRPEKSRQSSAAHHIDVSHLDSDLMGRSVRGGAATLVAQAVKVAVQACAIVILARLLAPDDFGRFAMVAAFLSALELLKDMGLSTATVQRPDVTARQLDTLFWVNAGLGLAAGIVMAALGPLLARLFGEPILTAIAPAVAIAFLFTGLASQHQALLRRQMRFGQVAVLQVAADVVGLCAAVAAAIAGLGIWALVIQRLGWAVTTAIGSWWACKWRPRRPGRLRDVAGIIRFGGNATASMVLGYMAGNLAHVLIGWSWGATALGFYERSQKLVLLPIQNLNVPLGNVAISALSRLTAAPDRYRTTYLGAVERLTMAITPVGGLLAAASDQVVALVFGDQWAAAAPVLAWMGLATVYMPVTYALSWLYMSQDRTPEMLRAGFASGVMTAAVVVAGLPFGPVGVAAAYAASGMLIRGPVLFWLAGRNGPVRISDLYRVVALPSLAWAAAAGAVAGAKLWLPVAPLSTVAETGVLAAVAVLAAIAVYLVFPRSRRTVLSLHRLPAMLRGATASA